MDVTRPASLPKETVPLLEPDQAVPAWRDPTVPLNVLALAANNLLDALDRQSEAGDPAEKLDANLRQAITQETLRSVLVLLGREGDPENWNE